MLSARSIKTLQSRAEYQNAFCFPIIEYYKNVGFDFEKESFEALAKEYIDLYHGEGGGSIGLYGDAVPTLEHARLKGIAQVILSASAQENLLAQLAPYGIGYYFSETLGISDIYARSKLDVGRAYIARTEIARAVLIGDTVHDYEVAEALGVDCLLVARGHQSRERLRTCGVPVLGRLTEALECI
jgi:phosphoglycolate phosphatase